MRHGSRHDVKKHTRTGKHQSYKAAVESTRPIAGFLTLDKDTSIIIAEVLAVDFLVEHNIPIAVGDHIGPLVKNMFPDLKIAGKAQMTTQCITSIHRHRFIPEYCHNTLYKLYSLYSTVTVLPLLII